MSLPEVLRVLAASGCRVDVHTKGGLSLHVHTAEEDLGRVVAHVLKVQATPPEYIRIVDGLADLLAGVYRAAADPLIREAADKLTALEGAPSTVRRKARAIVKQLEAALASAGAGVPEAVAGDVGRYLVAAFRLGQAEVFEPLGWKAAFTVVDADAVASLRDSGLYWIGNHYGESVPVDKMLSVVDEVLLRGGLGRREAGKEMARQFGHLFDRSDVYWRGLSSTMATRSRSFGAIGAMTATGAVEYEYMNPLDERTSDVCRELDGTVFSVPGAVDLRERLREADTPEAWKAISPWPKHADLLDASGARRPPAALQASGIAWPPLHFHCRSSVVARTWGEVTEADLHAAGALYHREAVAVPLRKAA